MIRGGSGGWFAAEVRKARLASLLLALLLPAWPVYAADLWQTWQAAQQHDPEFFAAQAAARAGQPRRDQARALWLPSAQLSATVGRMANNSSVSGARFSASEFGESTGVAFDTSVRNGTLERYSLMARQPIIDGERRAQSRQLTLAADMADLEWLNSQQTLMLRAAERYFEFMLADQALQVLRQQERAVERTLAEVRDRYQLGDKPITDTHEAVARAEAIKTQVLLADTNLQIKAAAFFDLTHLRPSALAALRLDRNMVAPGRASLDEWLELARRHNPALLIQEKQQGVAQEEANRHGALAAPTLELVGATSYDRLHGSGRFGAASSKTDNWMVGLQLNIPLFTGGYRDAKYQESLHLRDKARFDGRRLQQQVELQTRAAWLGVDTGPSRLSARHLALVATEARLDATRLGHAVGDRTTLELLDAEHAVSAARLALLETGIGWIMDSLRLAALAGNLNEAALRDVNDKLLLAPKG
ncbi:TolC family protein [Alcaligenaceae bacterium]|nr:TolC family protein [Alcaligenaceae bacterium]